MCVFVCVFCMCVFVCVCLYVRFCFVQLNFPIILLNLNPPVVSTDLRRFFVERLVLFGFIGHLVVWSSSRRPSFDFQVSLRCVCDSYFSLLRRVSTTRGLDRESGIVQDSFFTYFLDALWCEDGVWRL